MSSKLSELDTLVGRTISKVTWEPSSLAADEDALSLEIQFEDGSSLDLYASSYIIPEEPSIAAVVGEIPASD